MFRLSAALVSTSSIKISTLRAPLYVASEPPVVVMGTSHQAKPGPLPPSTSTMFFLQSPPSNKGAVDLHSIAVDGTLSHVSTPNDNKPNVRSGVHEYGGKIVRETATSSRWSLAIWRKRTNSIHNPPFFAVGGGFAPLKSKEVIFTNFSSLPTPHRLMLQSPDPTIPAIELTTDPAHRYGEFKAHPQLDRVCYAVQEDHADPSPSGVVNKLVHLDLSAVTPENPCPIITVIAEGLDFYTYPTVNLSATFLSFVGWSHSNMPWDDTEVYEVSLKRNGLTNATTKPQQISPNGSSNLMPLYSPLDSTLYYISDESNYYQIHKRQGASTVQLDLQQSSALEISTSGLGWVLGKQAFHFMHPSTYESTGFKGNVICGTYCLMDSGVSGVVLIFDSSSSEEQEQEAPKPIFLAKGETGCDEISEIAVGEDGKIYFIGGSHDIPEGLHSIDVAPLILAALSKDGTPPSPLQLPKLLVDPVVKDSNGDILSLITKDFTPPEHLLIPGKYGDIHAYYYPPSPSSTMLPKGTAPPLLVKAHGGPTSETCKCFRLDIQYWLLRGFAILDVDYSGSSGYGREYRHRMKGLWGECDREDVVSAAQYCVDQGMVNPKWISIDGGSAGGYTTLCALTFSSGVFTAGCSKYGISDLGALYEETHKFESKYMDMLIGKYPECKEVYHSRCPIMFVDQLSCPILLLQGTEDKVVPPNQAEMMYEAMKKKGIDTSLVLYKGEGHGFRVAANVEHALETEYRFFCKVWGIADKGGDLVLNERVEM
jgi:dipeptidyl aminopeptidase/acylaminoacyl peptidase